MPPLSASPQAIFAEVTLAWKNCEENKRKSLLQAALGGVSLVIGAIIAGIWLGVSVALIIGQLFIGVASFFTVRQSLKDGRRQKEIEAVVESAFRKTGNEPVWVLLKRRPSFSEFRAALAIVQANSDSADKLARKWGDFQSGRKPNKKPKPA
jgi:predicted lipid-binding transport protein (Tim44 family)